MRALWVALLGALLVAACSSGSSPAVRPSAGANSSPAPLTYVAMGASETAGVGTAQPERDSFPQHLLARLGRGAVLYDVGIPGETTAAALSDELPAALADRPDLVTVFFNVDDLVAGVSAQDFEARLGQIVGSLRAGGHTRVLVANTPPIDRLPAFVACQAGQPACPMKGAAIPSRDQLDALVADYNAAIGRVVAAHGSTLVDLSAACTAIATHPEYLASDGFHPSAAGAAVLAQAFFTAWRSTR